MSKTIWKHTLPRGEQVTLELPRGAQFLHLHQQDDTEVGLWFLADIREPKVTRYFLMATTESKAPPLAARYLGTAHLHGGSLTVHVFEVDGGGDIQHPLFQ
jgi:hypothetical protein